MYGYLRVTGGQPDEEILGIERDLATFAEVEGFCFGEIFHEFECGSQRAFLALVEELRRSAARDVVVPSTEHLAHNPVLRSVMLTSLRYWADARVWALDRS
ncbi:MAG: hypothetical protein DLM59_10755 [Pseudonocardiales bacterium]|nr:MAG: hypothetical protein DLM59_10755 [Pseudonocardiales bacterium]